MANDVKDTLETLMKIQEIDSQLAELEVSKVYFPQLLEELQGEIDSLSVNLKEVNESITDMKKNIDLKNLEMKQTEEKLKDAQDKLLQVGSNKEYDAVQHEIQNSEESIAQLEEDLIRLMEDLENAEKKSEELDEKLETSREENEKKISSIEEEFESIEQKVSRIEAKRSRLASKVNNRILNNYERISKGMNGHAIVKVTNRACGGCYQALPPRQCQEIRKMNKITFCEACGRILVWDDEVSS